MKNLDQEISDPLETLDDGEIIIGLVGPLGSDLNLITSELEKTLGEVGYAAISIRLSKGLHETAPLIGCELKDDGESERIESYMEAGTRLRERFGRGDALALLSIGQIRDERKIRSGDLQKPASRTAYILRSLKHKDEVDALRAIYGKSFFLISAYLPREKRKKKLAEQIANSKQSTNHTFFFAEAERLIQKDLDEEDKKLGQNVTGAFPLADFFVETNSIANVQVSIKRFVQMIFSYLFHTPTKDEYGMFLARSVALRSGDLSRQVGAAILDGNGNVISVGCNEVPKFGGGSYWSDDKHDHRDFQKGYDSNAKMKEEIIAELINDFGEIGLLNDSSKEQNATELAKKLIRTDAIKRATATNLLEFGRIVHAEMAAITTAALKGYAVAGGVLYCTTFPCHICARHIIAAGIKTVIYIEPYPKSRAEGMYEDSIVVDPSGETKDKLGFLPFTGVSPSRFLDFFDMKKRKEKMGGIASWQPYNASPKIDLIKPLYIFLEDNCIRYVNGQLNMLQGS